MDSISTSDSRVEQVSTPSTAETWHLGSVQALLEVIASLGSLLSELQGESKAVIQGEIDALSMVAIKHWRDYVDAALITRERDVSYILKETRMPLGMRLDAASQSVLVSWPDDSDASAPFFALGLGAKQTLEAPEFEPRSPFKELRLAQLPADTVLLDINDPSHAATAAVSEMVQSVVLDMEDYIARESAPDAWVLMRSHVAFYKRSVRLLEQGLCDDEFRGWDRTAYAAATIFGIPRAIVASTSTANAQQVLAVRSVASLYEGLLNEAEAEFGNNHQAMVDHVMQSLVTARDQIGSVLDGYNHILITTSKAAKLDVVPVPILRPIPHGLPVLALVPSGAPSLDGML